MRPRHCGRRVWEFLGHFLVCWTAHPTSRPSAQVTHSLASRLLASFEAGALRTRCVLHGLFVLSLLVAVLAQEPARARAEQLAVLAGYVVLASGFTAVQWRRGRCGHSGVLGVLGLLDAGVVSVLQCISGGSLMMIMALFLLPCLSVFHIRPRATAASICLSWVCFAAAAALNRRVLGQVRPDQLVAVAAFFAILSTCCFLSSVLHTRRVSVILGLVEARSHLLADVMTVEEKERRRLAEMLHDLPLQSVLAVRLDLEDVLNGGSLERLDAARETLLEVAGQLRLTTGQLFPPVLYASGLGEAVRSLAFSTAGRAGLAVRCDIGYAGSSPQDSVLYAAARELLDNVVRHARARNLSVGLHQVKGQVVLQIADDGIGMDLSSVNEQLRAGHIGLVSQRARIESAGGELKFPPDAPGHAGPRRTARTRTRTGAGCRRAARGRTRTRPTAPRPAGTHRTAPLTTHSPGPPGPFPGPPRGPQGRRAGGP